MTVVSYNGWSASPNPDAINIIRITVGDDTPMTVRASVAPIFKWLFDTYDRSIENIDGKILDDWGYNYRETRGGGSISNHASGTAGDVNALKYPRGTDNMGYIIKQQVRALHAKVDAAAGKHLMQWGGEWHGEYKDQMHHEMAEGTNSADVARTVKVLRSLPAINGANVNKALGSTTKKGRSSAPFGVRLVQKRLVTLGYIKGTYVHGYVGKKTRDAIRAWQKDHHYAVDGTPGMGGLEHLSHLAYNVH